MKRKLTLAACIMLSAFAFTGAARADCKLDISSGFIARGQAFTFTVSIWDFGPFPPNPFYTIVFFGTKNGVQDIPNTGEQYPGHYTYGNNVLTGFENPLSGGLSGTYVRWAVLYDPNGQVFCTTNPIPAILE
jgi:hypothetical protein